MNSLARHVRFLLLAVVLAAPGLAAGEEPAPNSLVRIKMNNGQQGDFLYVGKTATSYKLELRGMPLEIPMSMIASMEPIAGGGPSEAGSAPLTGPEGEARTAPSPVETVFALSDDETAALERMRQNIAQGQVGNCRQAIEDGAALLKINPRAARSVAPLLTEAFVAAYDDLVARPLGSTQAEFDKSEGTVQALIAKIDLPEMETAEGEAFRRARVRTLMYAALGDCYRKWLESRILSKSTKLEQEGNDARRKADRLPDLDAEAERSDRRAAWCVHFYKARLLAFAAGPGDWDRARGLLDRAENLGWNADMTRSLRAQIGDASVPTWYNKTGEPAAPPVVAVATPQATPVPQTRVGQIAAQAQGVAIELMDYLQGNWSVAALAAAAVFAFWVAPYILIWVQAQRGNVFAVYYRRRVMILGWLAYFAFLLHRAPGRTKKREKSEGAGEATVEAFLAAGESGEARKPGFLGRLFGRRKREPREEQRQGLMACHACGKPVDVPALYGRSLQFDRCPHCRVEIEPVIVFEDYLADLVERITETARSPKKKKKASEDLVSSHTMTTLISGLYILAVRRRATDIHVERNEEGAIVQFRIDGVLSIALKLPADVSLAFLSALKVQANLDITNHTTPQDGRYNLTIEGVELDMRVNCAPTTAQGEIFFTRLLDKRRIEIKPDALGFEGKNLDNFVGAIHKPHGLILVTGPTGSGKSTTLYVAMTQINTGERNIVTIEDPVEYQVPGLKQMQVNPEKKFTFATGLRSILRQDPDVILVGEIRDGETANMAIDAAATGHLVFTTLHTMDTATAVSRLNDLGVNAKRYSSALEIIIAQRLVRIICKSCKEQIVPRDPDLERLGILKLRTSIKFMAGRGCIICNATGYYDRRALLEIMKPDADLRAIMETETRAHVIRDAARRKGMRLLREEGILKIAAGLTTVEEVLRTTS